MASRFELGREAYELKLGKQPLVNPSTEIVKRLQEIGSKNAIVDWSILQETLALYVNSNWGVKISLVTLGHFSWSPCAPRREDVCGSGGVAPPFFTSALDKFDGSALRPVCTPHGERVPGTNWIKRLGGSGRCGIEKNLMPLSGIEPRPSTL
jgi:hypothetical protein